MTKNPFITDYYTEEDLKSFGVKEVGKNVKVAKNCTIVGITNLSIGSNVIIDEHCSFIITEQGFLNIGSYVHIGSFSHLLATDGIEIQDFSGLSQGVKIYSKTDDYSGNTLTNPTTPNKYKNYKKGKVLIQEHVIVGAGSVILPNVTIEEGVAIGALAVVSTNLKSWTIYYGNPIKKLTNRSKNLLTQKIDLLTKNQNVPDYDYNNRNKR
ncbi:acyltransferase [Maribacter sp.]|uniref:acyltransferase n=1 Tax=Maribacter sp. TaxID=1897614 RepID=UPI0025C51599|nr:acyltransferase [Maribacter sp.]